VTEKQSMGTYLRAARRRRRISIERAAEETKIRSDFLMRMESDEFDFLALAYVRGFLRTYARYLRVDPDPLLEEFDRQYGGRVDTAQIIAQQRRAKSKRRGYREPRKINSWVVASVLAAGVLITLAVIGLSGNNGPRRNPSEVARVEESPTPKATHSPTPRPSPKPTHTPSPTPTDAVLALADGIELQIVASNGDCWVDITSDGVNEFSGTIPVGGSETFSADKEMSIVLGYPAGVELVINGQNYGTPGDADPITIKLPDDVESL
jgi:cytoskeleton protein RodZ